MNRTSRVATLFAALGVAGCVVAPGPIEQQAGQANIACQQGDRRACNDAAYLQPAAAAERDQAQQQANVGTAVAAGVVGLVAGAAIVGSTNRGYRNDGYYRGPAYGGGYYGRPGYRRW